MISAISVKNIDVTLSGFKILNNINIEISQNEFLGIIGPNGGGKTTLLKVILGLLKPDCGEVFIMGKPIKDSLNLLGYVPQYNSFEKDFPISVFDVVKIGTIGKSFKNKNEVVNKVLKQVEMYEYKNRLINELSGGQKQRVLIARALVSSPKILLLDEPTASVDTKNGRTFYELLKELNKNITIVLVSHDIGVLSQYVTKIACLNKNLVYHDSKEISHEMLEETYHCPVDLIAHGVPHRVLGEYINE
ncbi:MAG TPA: metal ABC transporter ATP-binding protein [Melioribacteraceae bacterium]|nr:metal ABC transporter ATP-binding protein [Melioribacteraceae bacterium]